MARDPQVSQTPGGSYMGAERAEGYGGRRNGAEGELPMRVVPQTISACRRFAL